MTKNKVFDALDKTFETTTKELETAKPVIEKALNDGLDSDFQEARDALKRAMVYGEEAIQGIMNVATNSDNPRAYEVAGQLIKSLGDQAKDMMDIQAKKKKIDEVNGKPAATKIGHQTNVLFNGSTSDLMKALKEDDAPIIEGGINGSSD
ncbi:terminase [bacterium]|nr:terminase [bacterium]